MTDQTSLEVLGWTPSTIDVATTNGKQSITGWRKGSFAIVEMNYESIPVVSLTHIVTGWRMAAFYYPKDAAIAGDLAEQCADWSSLTDPTSSKSPEWREINKRMIAIWEVAGISKRFTTDDGHPVYAISTRNAANVKKAILDDDGYIVGVGDTEEEARADALKTIESAKFYLAALVEEMMVRDVSPALASKAMRDGGDVPMKQVCVDGKWMLVTPEEATLWQIDTSRPKAVVLRNGDY